MYALRIVYHALTIHQSRKSHTHESIIANHSPCNGLMAVLNVNKLCKCSRKGLPLSQPHKCIMTINDFDSLVNEI